jgi:drug/metabolite transporter superfamily protein YnfA
MPGFAAIMRAWCRARCAAVESIVDWTTLLRLPSTVLLVLAGLVLLLALFELVALRQRQRTGRPLAAAGHGLLLLVALALALLLAGAGLGLRGYRLLAEDEPVVEIDARILSPQRWALTLTWPDGSTRQVALAGDAFRVEAVVVKWKLPALLAGAPALYRLDRLSGRYDDASQEAQAPRTVIGFDEAGAFDLLDLKKQYPAWLPGVDTLYGSGAYLPLVDQGHYEVGLMRTGALVARPDEATVQRLGQPFQ